MKKFQTIALLTGLALTGTTAFTSCSSSDDLDETVVYDDHGQAGVKSEFVISIPRKVVNVTRQSDNVVQKDGSSAQFRGIDNIRLVPFANQPTLTSKKLSDIISLSAVSSLSQAGSDNYKVYSDQFVPINTRYFLFYGRAIANNQAEADYNNMDDKFKYGVLKAKGLTDGEFSTVNSISFSLEQINASEDAQAGDATGQAIVALLNQLATAADGNNKWSNSNNSMLAMLYKKFTGLCTASSKTLAIMLSKIYVTVDQIPAGDTNSGLADEIKRLIMTACSSTPVKDEPAELKSSYDGYPANIGLPDGASRVRWNGSAFEDVSAHYGKGYELKITDYCYPAALWYYADSPLRAASEKKSDLYDTADDWTGVIHSVYSDGTDVVQAGTQSVAMTNSAEYGVGRLETQITMKEGVYYDANGKEVAIGSGYKLTGLLLGGQSSVYYDFTSKGSGNLTIYDRDIDNNIICYPNTTTPTNQTLALETEKGKTIYAALELVNNGEEFMGADGVIPAGGTFYLAVKLDPTKATNYNDGTLDKLIQQDYVTQLTITILNGATSVDRDGNGIDDKYVIDPVTHLPIGVDTNGDGIPDDKKDGENTYDINDDGTPDAFIKDPEQGGPGWDINGDGKVDIPLLPGPDGNYPESPSIPEGLGNATNGIPDMTSPGVELGTSVNLDWKKGLILNPEI